MSVLRTIFALSTLVLLYAVHTAAVRCEGDAIYLFKFDGKWSAARHGSGYVEGGMFSPLAFTTHNRRWFMWAPSTVASKGFQNIAEGGDATVMGMEVEFNCGEDCGPYIQMPCMPMGTGTCDVEFQFTASRRYPYFSWTSMFSATPDWVTGTPAYDLCDRETGMWKEMVELMPLEWDAGTDSGMGFQVEDVVTDPQELVELIPRNADSPFYNNITNRLPPTSKLTVTLLLTIP